MAHDS